MSSLRLAINNYNKSVDGIDAMETGKQTKRGSLSTNILIATTTLEWLSVTRLPFTVNDLAAELDVSDTTARKLLRTVETVGWVERSDKGREQDRRGQNPHTYKALVRIRRI